MWMFAVGVWQCKNDKELRARAKEIMAKYQAEKKVRITRKETKKVKSRRTPRRRSFINAFSGEALRGVFLVLACCFMPCLSRTSVDLRTEHDGFVGCLRGKVKVWETWR